MNVMYPLIIDINTVYWTFSIYVFYLKILTVFYFRPAGGRGATKPLDPQRVPRPFPGVSDKTDSGTVTSSHKHYSNTLGNARTEGRTSEYTMKSGDGNRIVKSFSEQQVTRYDSGGLSSGVSPAISHGSVTSGEHKSRSTNRIANVWQPPSHSNLQKSQSTLDISFGHRKKSPIPDEWQYRSLSPAPGSHSSGHQLRPPSSRSSRSVRSSSVDQFAKPRSERSTSVDQGAKENADPFIAREQKKWEATHVDLNPPKFKYDSSGQLKAGGMKYTPPRMDDPKYPMFEVPKNIWVPPKINEPSAASSAPGPKKWAPPVPPKPRSRQPSPIMFNPLEAPVAGSEHHRPGMIRPPQQFNLMPAPPPPPLPPSPSDNPRFNVVPITSKLGIDTHSGHMDYDEPDHMKRPDHLPVFQPRVVFAPDEEDGMMLSPDRIDGISDISSHRSKFPSIIINVFLIFYFQIVLINLTSPIASCLPLVRIANILDKVSILNIVTCWIIGIIVFLYPLQQVLNITYTKYWIPK